MVDDVGNDCRVSVDGTDCLTENQGLSHKAFFSFKFKYAGLRYEVGVCIRTGYIVWVRGPYPCGDWNDITIFRQGMKYALDENERVEADDGYTGEDPALIKTPGGVRFMEDMWWLKKRSKVRQRGETANHRLKTFKVLCHRFHHDLDKHSMCFRAAAVFTQLSFEVGTKALFEVPNYDQIWMDPTRAPLPEDDMDQDLH